MFVFLRPLIDQQIIVYSGSSTSGDVEEPPPLPAVAASSHPADRQVELLPQTDRCTDRQVELLTLQVG